MDEVLWFFHSLIYTVGAVCTHQSKIPILQVSHASAWYFKGQGISTKVVTQTPGVITIITTVSDL